MYISRRWTFIQHGGVYSVLCSFELNIDAGKYLKNNTHSYLYILSNMTNNNWFVYISCYCKSNIDTGKIPS